MVRGRPVRACSKINGIYANSKIKDSKVVNGTPKKLDNSTKKNQSITDYFQAVAFSEDSSKEKYCERTRPIRSTRKNANGLVNSQSFAKVPSAAENPRNTAEIIEKDKSITESPIAINKVQNMTLNGIKSPSTPHRITLCNDIQEAVTNGKTDVKNFQKPTVAPKARRKLNTNRLHGIDDKPLATNNHKLTDYFPVRRSIRKTKTTVLEEKQRCLEKILRNNLEDGLKICYFDGKGRGIVADKPFKKGEFVVEYSGDLIDTAEAKRREEFYALDQNAGCYMYYFKHNGLQYCIDATPETDRLGRLVNHSRNGNLVTRTISVDGKPRLVLIAREDIQIGEELLYDYGDRSKESLRHHPWLAN